MQSLFEPWLYNDRIEEALSRHKANRQAFDRISADKQFADLLPNLSWVEAVFISSKTGLCVASPVKHGTMIKVFRHIAFAFLIDRQPAHIRV